MSTLKQVNAIRLASELDRIEQAMADCTCYRCEEDGTWACINKESYRARIKEAYKKFLPPHEFDKMYPGSTYIPPSPAPKVIIEERHYHHHYHPHHNNPRIPLTPQLEKQCIEIDDKNPFDKQEMTGNTLLIILVSLLIILVIAAAANQ